MKKLIGFVLVILIFIGIGYGVKRYVDGPSQPVDAILVSGTKANIKDVKKLYEGNTKETADFKYKFIVKKNVSKITEAEKQEFREKGIENFDDETVYEEKYTIISQSTAKQLLKYGIIRTKVDPEDASMISKPLKEIKDLSNEENLFFTAFEAEKLDLNGQIVKVKSVVAAWIGYQLNGYLVVLDDQEYSQIKESELEMTMIQLRRGHFDYKDVKKREEVIRHISSVYKNNENMINFMEVEKPE